jgi:hypothetical protein
VSHVSRSRPSTLSRDHRQACYIRRVGQEKSQPVFDPFQPLSTG